MSGFPFPLEGNPRRGQRQRVEHVLRELQDQANSWRVELVVADDEICLVDTEHNTVLGVGLEYTRTTDGRIFCNFRDSILDGVWLVDTPDGPVEQRFLEGDR